MIMPQQALFREVGGDVFLHAGAPTLYAKYVLRDK
jgi:hypothetical protein